MMEQIFNEVDKVFAEKYVDLNDKEFDFTLYDIYTFGMTKKL